MLIATRVECQDERLVKRTPEEEYYREINESWRISVGRTLAQTLDIGMAKVSV